MDIREIIEKIKAHVKEAKEAIIKHINKQLSSFKEEWEQFKETIENRLNTFENEILNSVVNKAWARIQEMVRKEVVSYLNDLNIQKDIELLQNKFKRQKWINIILTGVLILLIFLVLFK